MSGEAGGALAGGVLLLGALPLIVAGVAVVGVAAGTVRLGQAAVRAYKREEERRTKQNALELGQCSTELNQLYGRFQEALAAQSAQNLAFYQELERQTAQFSANLLKLAEGADEKSHIDEAVRKERENAAHSLEDFRDRELTRIRQEAKQQTEAALSVLKAAESAKMEAADWAAQTAAAKAGQQAVAGSLLRDAEASSNLLRRLADSSGDAVFRERAAEMERDYHRVAAMMDSGNFQAAAAQSQRIITRSAEIAIEQELKERELSELRVLLDARLEALSAQLDKVERLSFSDSQFGDVEETLDDFTQGVFQSLREQVDEMHARLGSGTAFSKFQLESMLNQVEDELVPRADEVIRVGHENILRYYERLHALQITQEYMEGQGYEVDWAQTAGDDPTQKLVVHFREPVSGNTIAVSLDEDAGSEDIGRMAMEVMFYYANGRPVTEAEKENLRKGMIQAVRKAGLDGNLACTGSVDREADNKVLDNPDALRDMPVRRVL